jgi:hypothetical protein
MKSTARYFPPSKAHRLAGAITFNPRHTVTLLNAKHLAILALSVLAGGMTSAQTGKDRIVELTLDQPAPRRQQVGGARSAFEAQTAKYLDGRPAAGYRLEARDHGVVLRHGSGPGNCDALGARDVWVWQHGGAYYMH